VSDSHGLPTEELMELMDRYLCERLMNGKHEGYFVIKDFVNFVLKNRSRSEDTRD
jgi:hypothetical protein